MGLSIEAEESFEGSARSSCCLTGIGTWEASFYSSFLMATDWSELTDFGAFFTFLGFSSFKGASFSPSFNKIYDIMERISAKADLS